MRALLLVGWLQLSALQGGEWSTLWDQLERLRGSEPASAESAGLRVSLLAAAQARPLDPRADLLRAELEVLAGRRSSAVALRLAALQPDPFVPRERWLLADVLPPGPERAQQVLAALQGDEDLSRWQLVLAWSAAVEEARALRIPGAGLPIQERLYERCPADWSATDLALTRRSLGDERGADKLLAETIARETAYGRPTAALWTQRGIGALGFGDERRARDYLGRALAQGSDDANLVLSRLDLLEARVGAARRGFRTSILKWPPQDWAWRGWGMTLLPAQARLQPRASPL